MSNNVRLSLPLTLLCSEAGTFTKLNNKGKKLSMNFGLHALFVEHFLSHQGHTSLHYIHHDFRSSIHPAQRLPFCPGPTPMVHSFSLILLENPLHSQMQYINKRKDIAPIHPYMFVKKSSCICIITI